MQGRHRPRDWLAGMQSSDTKPSCHEAGEEVGYGKHRRGTRAMEPGDKAINEYLSFEPASFDILNRFEVQQHEIWEDTYSIQIPYSQ